MKVYFIRHAQSEANAGGRTVDPTSIAITKVGREQSLALADKIILEPDLVVVTPHMRTRETALPLIHKFPSCAVETWPLHEFTFLSPVDCRDTSASERRPLVQHYWERCDPDYVHGEGAESFSQFSSQRVAGCIDKIRSRRLNFTVLFTHEQVILLIKLMLSGGTVTMANFREQVFTSKIENVEIFETAF